MRLRVKPADTQHCLECIARFGFSVKTQVVIVGGSVTSDSARSETVLSKSLGETLTLSESAGVSCFEIQDARTVQPQIVDLINSSIPSPESALLILAGDEFHRLMVSAVVTKFEGLSVVVIAEDSESEPEYFDLAFDARGLLPVSLR